MIMPKPWVHPLSLNTVFARGRRKHNRSFGQTMNSRWFKKLLQREPLHMQTQGHPKWRLQMYDLCGFKVALHQVPSRLRLLVLLAANVHVSIVMWRVRTGMPCKCSAKLNAWYWPPACTCANTSTTNQMHIQMVDHDQQVYLVKCC